MKSQSLSNSIVVPSGLSEGPFCLLFWLLKKVGRSQSTALRNGFDYVLNLNWFLILKMKLKKPKAFRTAALAYELLLAKAPKVTKSAFSVGTGHRESAGKKLLVFVLRRTLRVLKPLYVSQ